MKWAVASGIRMPFLIVVWSPSSRTFQDGKRQVRLLGELGVYGQSRGLPIRIFPSGQKQPIDLTGSSNPVCHYRLRNAVPDI